MGFKEESYTVSESDGNVSVCVVLTGQIDISLTLNVSVEGMCF